MRSICDVTAWLQPIIMVFFLGAPTLLGQGWQDLSNTSLQSVCPPNNFQPAGGGMPPYNFNDNCHNVIDAWSGATLDTKRNRLIIFGGGHAAYSGNEVYSLDLSTISSTIATSCGADNCHSSPTVPAMTRLTDPSNITMTCSPQGTTNGTTPSSMHTYQGLVYLPQEDKVLEIGGLNACGNQDNNAWLFDMNTLTWTKGASWGTGLSLGALCALDPTQQAESVICLIGNDYLTRYTPATNTWTQVSSTALKVGYGSSIVVDPDRRNLYMIGPASSSTVGSGEFFQVSLAAPTVANNWTSQISGCGDAFGYPYPSVEWDPALHRVVIYVPRTVAASSADNEVFIFDPATKSCVQQPILGGPPASGGILGPVSVAQGMLGRFRYIPSGGYYVVVNNASTDAYKVVLNANQVNGLGSSTWNCVDRDGDGYGTGPGCLGPDADDLDAGVHSAAQFLTKWSTIPLGLNHLGYNPANIWYVSTTGNDSTGMVNNASLPFATCCGSGKANPASGDAVLFRGGTYNFTVVFPSGTAGAPTILMSYPGEQAQFTSVGGVLYSILGATWTIVDGFLFHANTSGSGCINAGSNANVVFRHIDASGCEWGIVASGDLSPFIPLSDFTIEDSVFHDSAASDGQHGIYLAAHGGVVNTNIFVRRNLLFNNTYTGMQANGQFHNLIQEQNITTNNAIAGFAWEEGVSNSFNRSNVSINDVKGLLNISTYNGAEGLHTCSNGTQTCTCPPNTLLQGAICPYNQNNNLIENNTVYRTSLNRFGGGDCYDTNPNGNEDCRPGIEVGRQGGAQCTTAMCIASDNGSNTFQNNVIQLNNSANGYTVVQFDDATSPLSGSTSTVRNILGYNLGFQGIVSSGTLVYTCSGASAFLAAISGCTNADPLFVSASNSYYNTPGSFNLNLQSSSPAVQVGTPDAFPRFDLVGNLYAIPPSLGAYELALQSPAANGDPCDLNFDGVVNGADVLDAINQALGVSQCTTADLQQNGQCNVVDVQRVINAALGAACQLGP